MAGAFERRVLFKYRTTPLSFQTLTAWTYLISLKFFSLKFLKQMTGILKKGLFYGFLKIPKAED